MALELVLPPDTEAAVVTILTADSRIQAFAPVIVSSTYMGYQNGQTWVHVYRRGGTNEWPVQDNASMFFDVLASTREVCNLLARTVHGVMHAHRGDIVGTHGNGLVITNIINSMGIQWLPDETGYPRYSFAMVVSARSI